MRRLAVLAAVLTASLLLALPAGASGPSVGVKDASFGPSRLSIKKNTTVTFRWKGDLAHNVRATSVPRGARKFNSGVSAHRRPFSRKFTVKGTYRIICDIHGYTGRIVVR